MIGRRRRRIRRRRMGGCGCGWSDLSEDLVRAIARRLTVAVDRVRFSTVCKWWEFVAKSERNYLPRRPPWLMLAESSSTRGFVGLSSSDSDDEEEEKVFEVDFPEGRGNKCLGSTGTWLITADERLGMHLLNPLTRDHIELPPISTFGRIYEELNGYDEEDGRPSNLYYRDIFIKKAVLRWLPPDHHQHQQQQGQEQEEQDYIVIAIYYTTKVLAFTRRCSKSWTTIEIHSAPLFCDVIFYNAKGKFYGVTHRGVVMEIGIDIDGGSDPKTIQVFGPFTRMDDNLPSNYLVECSGQLFQVIKFMDDLDDDPVYETTRFEVFALDFASGTRTELKSLGRHSLFLGDNTSVALSADSFSTTTFNANCIYFTDDYKLGYMGNEMEGGRDMGVFNLESGTIKPHCKRVSLSYFSPPLWIIP